METCPDETLFVDLAAGRLTAAEVEQLEAHLDRCAMCTDLFTFLASLNAPHVVRYDEPRLKGSGKATLATVAMTSFVLSAAQLAWLALMGRFAIRSAEYCDSVGCWRAMPPYCAGIGIGWLLGVGATCLMYWRKNVIKWLIPLQAWISIASFTLAPLGIVVLMMLRKGERGSASRRELKLG